MFNFRIVSIFSASLLCLAGSLAADPRTEKLDEDEWFAVRIQDQPCGYMHTTMRTVGNEVHSRALIQLKIARNKAKVNVSIDQEYRETPEGIPLALVSKVALAEVPVIYSGTIEDGKITLTTEQFGIKRTAKYPFDPEIRFTYGQILEQRKNGLKPGTVIHSKAYDPSLRPDGPVEVDFKCGPIEEIDVLGKKQRLHHMTASMKLDSMPGQPAATPTSGGEKQSFTVDSDLWVDDEARPVITTMDMGIAKVRMYLSTKDEALKDAEPPDIFLNTFIPIDRSIGKEPREVKYRLIVPAGSSQGLPDLPNTSMQTFKRLSKYEGELTVHRIDWKKLRKITDDPEARQMTEFLRASPIVDINDSKIKRLARTAVKGQNTPAEKADALRKFVTDYIENKSMDVGFATASEVARTKQGDCTEHGVLLAALARAAGLPARGVSGIVEVPMGYMDEGKHAFGYHMWAQVCIGGKWVDIDGALRQSDCDVTHIALSLMPLNEEGMVDSLVALVPLLGKLEIKIESVK